MKGDEQMLISLLILGDFLKRPNSLAITDGKPTS
jgi:hypothetical protein